MPANLHTIEALKEAKAALARFAEDAGALLANVDSDVARMGQWLTHERPAHWKSQVRKREEAVQEARREISRKQLAAAPEPASTVLERKVLARAQEKLAEGQKRQQNTRRWAGVWEKESLMARGSISQLADFVRADIPRAIARIDRMMVQVEEYLSIRAPSAEELEGVGAGLGGGGGGGEGGGGGSMARPLADGVATTAESGPVKETRIENYEYLRPLAAEARARAKVPRDAIEWRAMMLDVLSERHQMEIAGLATMQGGEGVGGGVGAGQTMVVAANALDRPAVWLLRMDGADPEAGSGEADSGWYMGPLDTPMATGACWRVPVAEVVAARPDLRALLAGAGGGGGGAKVGTLAILGPGGPLAVLDAGGRNVWLAEQ